MTLSQGHPQWCRISVNLWDCQCCVFGIKVLTMKIVLMSMTESFLTFFICYSSAHLTNQKPANPAAQPMRALPAPPTAPQVLRPSCSSQSAPCTCSAHHSGSMSSWQTTRQHTSSYGRFRETGVCLRVFTSPASQQWKDRGFLRAGEEEEEGNQCFRIGLRQHSSLRLRKPNQHADCPSQTMGGMLVEWFEFKARSILCLYRGKKSMRHVSSGKPQKHRTHKK